MLSSITRQCSPPADSRIIQNKGLTSTGSAVTAASGDFVLCSSGFSSACPIPVCLYDEISFIHRRIWYMLLGFLKPTL